MITHLYFVAPSKTHGLRLHVLIHLHGVQKHLYSVISRCVAPFIGPTDENPG